ncbi:MAG: hypothetical protein ACFFCV_10470 [Promethearchaeota archaeon]
MLSIVGWFEGIITSSIFFFGLVTGLIFIFKSKKTKAKLLLYMGLLIMVSSIIYLGVFLDFLTVLVTNRNLDNTNGLHAVIIFMWAAPVGFIATFVGAELTIKKGKTLILVSFLIFGLFYEILIFINPFQSLHSVHPNISGDNLIHTNVIFGTPVSFLLIFLFGYVLTIVDIGFLYKGIKSRGIVRKKYFILAFGFVLYHIIIFFDAYTNPKTALIIMRGLTFVCFFLWYFGLKEEIIATKYIPPEKEVKIEDSLFRLSELKPGEISEEEVTFFREQKICLVCRGDVKGFNYICTKCDALYCENCARNLTRLENACWVCNTPFDKTKPSKPYTRETEDNGIEKIKNSK